MTNEIVSPPRWFWIVAGIALLWNLMGVAAFVAQLTMDTNTLSVAEQAFYEQRPMWALAAFALAVFGGAIGCIALLLRKHWALLMLGICVAGIVVQNIHSIFIAGGIETFGEGALVLPAVTLLIGIALIYFAHVSKSRGWIN